MKHWVLQAAVRGLQLQHKKKNHSLITQKQMISMQIEFVNIA